MVTSLDRRTAR